MDKQTVINALALLGRKAEALDDRQRLVAERALEIAYELRHSTP